MVMAISCLGCETLIPHEASFYVNLNGIICTGCFRPAQFSMESIIVKPLEKCSFVKRCHNRATFQCSYNGLFFCIPCHRKHCDPGPTESPCQAESIVHGSRCSKCDNFAFYMNTETNSMACDDCFGGQHDFKSISDEECKEVSAIVSTLASELDDLKRQNSSIIKKMDGNVKYMNMVLKSCPPFDKGDLSCALEDNKKVLVLNIKRNKNLGEIIKTVTRKNDILEILDHVLVQRRVDFHEIISMLKGCADTIRSQLSAEKSVKKVHYQIEETELQASQPSCSDASSGNHGNSLHLLKTQEDHDEQGHDVSSQNSNGPFIEFDDNSPQQLELLYHRGPFWLVFLDSNAKCDRESYIDSLKNFRGHLMNPGQIKPGLHVVIKEEPRFGSSFKRGLVTRQGRTSNTWCVNLLDFGKSLVVDGPRIYQIPESLNEKEPTFWIGRLMGIKPVSNFAFTSLCKPNASSVINGTLVPQNRMLTVSRHYQNGDHIFCQVLSCIRGQVFNWTRTLINLKVALPYTDEFQCFLPSKDYCYFFHVMGQCESITCVRSHECSFCQQSSHRFIKCKNYQTAEVNLAKSG